MKSKKKRKEIEKEIGKDFNVVKNEVLKDKLNQHGKDLKQILELIREELINNLKDLVIK